MNLVIAEAYCAKCEWKTAGKNAMGNGARHYKKTGHEVNVDLHFIHDFGKPKLKV